VTAFLSHLAARGVSASTQNQALSAVLFLYEVVLGQRLGWMNEIVRYTAAAARILGYRVGPTIRWTDETHGRKISRRSR